MAAKFGLLRRILSTDTLTKPIFRGLSQMSSLSGRNFLQSTDYTSDELKFLLWTAIDLKNKFKISRDCKHAEPLKGPSTSVLLDKPLMTEEFALSNAVKFSGGHFHVVVDPHWPDNSPRDIGRCLAGLSEIIFVSTHKHTRVNCLADGASVPVVNLGSCTYKPLQGLADAMSIYEHFGYLRSLTVGWIGPICPMLNTYLTLFPHFGMNIKFSCNKPQVPEQSPVVLDDAVKLCNQNGTELHECVTLTEAIYHSHIISTTTHDICEMQITMKMLAEASPEWIFFTELPHSRAAATDEVFYDARSHAWNSVANLQWVIMSVLVQLTREYRPTIPRPDFEKTIFTNNECET